MSIVHMKNQEVYYVGFKGVGICFTVEDGKLALTNPSDDDTAESALNDFLENIRGFVKARRSDMRKNAAILPLITFMKESGLESGMPPEIAEEITKALTDNESRCRGAITEAEDLIIDVSDLMMKFDIKIKTSFGDDKPQKDSAESRLKSILAKINGGR
ncbi:MAG: hypothetical protein JWM85_3618 [Acidimicrobiaceae bacterium]|nr:hypothetical protein [Acidimicrobiaceae bacterium]